MISECANKFISGEYMKTSLRLIPLFVLLTLNGNAQTQDYVYIDSLVAEVLQNNPELKAARNITNAAKTKIDQVSTWEPPEVGVEFFQTPIQSFPNPFKD